MGPPSETTFARPTGTEFRRPELGRSLAAKLANDQLAYLAEESLKGDRRQTDVRMCPRASRTLFAPLTLNNNNNTADDPGRNRSWPRAGSCASRTSATVLLVLAVLVWHSERQLQVPFYEPAPAGSAKTWKQCDPLYHHHHHQTGPLLPTRPTTGRLARAKAAPESSSPRSNSLGGSDCIGAPGVS